ncbi:MAG: NADH-quinone oxidoreductase subunit NuoN [Pseudomonadota bacterium]
MTPTIATPVPFDFAALMPLWPEVTLALSALLFVVMGAVWGNGGARHIAFLGIITCAVVGALCWQQPHAIGEGALVAANGQFLQTEFSRFVKYLILGGVAATLMLHMGIARTQAAMNRFEYPILLILSACGMFLMVSANDFLTLYVGLELQSLALYVLAAFRRDDIRSAEAGLKYFVLGALSSGLLLFGISLIYGFSGTISYPGLAALGALNPGVMMGVVFVMAGLAFKISAVPFHMWTPDVYEGSPTLTTAFFALVPKVAAMAALTNILLGPLTTQDGAWSQIIVFIAAASLIWAAFAGIGQRNIKRLLAYSSIGNIGFILLGLLVGSATGVSAMLVYLVIYMVMTVGTFAAILSLSHADGNEITAINDLSGLSKTHPFQAYIIAIMMFSIAGIPPLAGFLSKVVIINAVLSAGYMGLAVLAVLASVVAAYYYLRVIQVMFFEAPPAQSLVAVPCVGSRALMLFSALFVMALLIAPSWLLVMTDRAAAALFG